MPARDRGHYGRDFVLRRQRMMRAIASRNVRAAYIEAPHLFPGDLATATEMLCWQCGQPLATCGPNKNGRHRNGRPARWTAGHTADGDSSKAIVPECSPCNSSRGAAAGNRRRTRPGRRRTRRRG